MIPVLKKLASLLLSLLLCLSLLPGQAIAADTMEDVPPVQTEAPETGHPNDPDELITPAAQEYPEEIETDHSKN
jgi:hypothetical protein